MTQDKWNAMSAAEKEAARDNSGLHPALRGWEGRKVTVSPKREYGRSTFIVGRTTGWRPAHLAMRAGAYGSSDLIGPEEQFTICKVWKGR